MKFYNRKEEISILRRIAEAKGARFIIIKGLRRIGKTRLVLEALKNKKYAYIFVPKDETVSGFLEFLSKDLGIPKFSTIYDFLNYIFEKYDYIFLDEFQNFYYMEKSAYSYLQKIFDEYKTKDKSLCLFVSGSSYSLLKKIFSDYSKALYGRKDLEINLQELDIKTIWQILDDLDIKNSEDKIKFWSIFGGIPKYYELVEILKPNSFNKFVDLIFLHNYKSMLDEGKTILISEFGGEYKSYYSVIEAIAEGKTKISEIATKFNNDINSANRYADLIRKEYRLVNRVESIIGKKGLYQIENNFLSFWFNFIKRYESYYEQGKVNNISDFFKENFDSYVGKLFEKFCFIFVKEHLPPTFSFTKIGKQWGKIPSAPKDKNQYEIDICAINKKDKEILFAECKWKDKVNVDEVLKDLVEKSKHVQWNNGKRNESYAIFAKSFNKKIKEFNGKKIYCFDLKDMENLFKQT